ncbi:MAG: hypothetical protein AAF993_22360 [Pseudomonadota bacterium]
MLLLSACSSNPPRQPDNVCAIFAEKRGWHKQARKAQKRWGTPVHIAMAFVHRESAYVADAKPPRKKLLGIVPWRRLSSAYGYAQATDDTWREYEAESRRWFTDRDDFADAMDFIGWYNHRSHRRLGIAKTDAYRLYLAYYTGHGGYRRGVWKGSATIQGYARKVSDQANRYHQQLRRC